MTALTLSHIYKSFADKPILHDVSFSLYPGEKVGLVGANGSGKSTLVKILMGSLEPDNGDIRIPQTVSIGHLPQTLTDSYQGTLQDVLAAAQREVLKLQAEMDALAADMGRQSGDQLDQTLARYGEVSAQFDARDGYNLDTRTDTVLQGLGLAKIERDRPLSTLSGGEKTRLGLAALLIGSPELLILDEPTNHLDFEMLAWLEAYLDAFAGTLLVVSHDRQFLNQTVTRILELDEWDHQVRSYTGNYVAYTEQKAAERARQAAMYAQQQAEIRELERRIREAARGVGHNRPPKDNNKMAYNGHGQSVDRTVARNIHAAEAQLQRILADPVPRPPQPLAFQASLSGDKVHQAVAVHLRDVRVDNANGTALLKAIEFTLAKRDRALIIGPNGAGKSTLLNVMAGTLAPHEGERFVPAGLRVGYLSQEIWFADGAQTVLEYFAEGLSGDRDEHIAKLLSYQLFRFEDFALRVGELSPGQARKLDLARLMEQKPGLLLIDEPTNHVSFDILEALEAAIETYEGPLVVVSHDRWFIDRFRGDVYHLADGHLEAPANQRLGANEEARMRKEIERLGAYGIDGKGTKLK